MENDRMEREKDEFHLKVYNGFKEIEKRQDNFLAITPEVDKSATSAKIIAALKEKGLIR